MGFGEKLGVEERNESVKCLALFLRTAPPPPPPPYPITQEITSGKANLIGMRAALFMHATYLPSRADPAATRIGYGSLLFRLL